MANESKTSVKITDIPIIKRITPYPIALTAIFAAFLLHRWLEQIAAGVLPPYFTYYPVIMIIALAGGLGPGIISTIGAALLTDYCVLSQGGFGAKTQAEAVSLTFFTSMGVFMSAAAERYRRSRNRLKKAVGQRTAELINANEHLSEKVGECRRIEQTLIQNEERLRFHLENSPLAVIEWDRDFMVTRWAGEAEKIFGWYAEETIGRPIMDLRMIYGEDIPVVQETIEKLTNGTSRHVVSSNRNYTKDGRVIYCTWYNSILQDAQGKMSSVLSFVLDITDRVRAQEALREAHDELEARVRKRTTELQKANEALQAEISERKRMEAQVLRARRMESLSTLAAGIAHDFNNILTPIMLNSSAALMDLPKSNPARKYMEHTLTSAERAKGLVQQILTYSLKGEYDLKTLNFQDVLMNSLDLVKASSPSNIEIRRKIEKCGPILADPAQMEQVVKNLCTNAFQAMQERGGVLEIALEEVDIETAFATRNMNLKPGKYIRLTVRDTGHGMDEATIERIFDPFYTTKGTGGTGLGLPVVLGIVIGHGGDIDVQSRPGGGSAFKVYLPRGSDEKKQPETKTGNDFTGNERILFVDDEQEIAFMGKEMLERFGYDVAAKTDSLEALEEFRANPDRYDLVVTDYAMSTMNGLELAKNLNNIRPDILIFISSGFNEAITPEKLKMCGIYSLVMKPYSVIDLAKAIRHALVQRQKNPQYRKNQCYQDNYKNSLFGQVTY